MRELSKIRILKTSLFDLTFRYTHTLQRFILIYFLLFIHECTIDKLKINACLRLIHHKTFRFFLQFYEFFKPTLLITGISIWVPIFSTRFYKLRPNSRNIQTIVQTNTAFQPKTAKWPQVRDWPRQSPHHTDGSFGSWSWSALESSLSLSKCKRRNHLDPQVALGNDYPHLWAPSVWHHAGIVSVPGKGHAPSNAGSQAGHFLGLESPFPTRSSPTAI